MKRNRFIIAVILFIFTVVFIYAQTNTVIYEWKIRSDSWEGVDLKVHPSWQISKGLDTLFITDDAAAFLAVISLRYEGFLDLEKLLSKLQIYEEAQLYKTKKIKDTTPLMAFRDDYTLGYYSVFGYQDTESPRKKGEYKYICHALYWLDDNLYLDALLLTNNIDDDNFRQFILMLESSIPMFGK